MPGINVCGFNGKMPSRQGSEGAGNKDTCSLCTGFMRHINKRQNSQCHMGEKGIKTLRTTSSIGHHSLCKFAVS